MIKNQEKFQKLSRREQGAALVTSLILLLVLTVLGVSTMSTATMEMRMAANNQFHENAFQLAETGLDGDLARLNAGNMASPVPQGLNQVTGVGNCSAPTAGAVPELGGTFTNTICYTGVTGLVSGTSINLMVNFMFQDDSQSVVGDPTVVGDTKASSLQSLGIKILGPAAAGQQGQQ